MAQKAAEQAVSDIVDGVVSLPPTEKKMRKAQRAAAAIVRDENTKHKKAELIKNVQQLRLREPDMVKKEYQALVQQVKDREAGDIAIQNSNVSPGLDSHINPMDYIDN